MNQDQQSYRYPWLRNLFLLVLYVALLVFLWNFPLEVGRVFFRNLMGGFLYLLAGLIVVAVTVLLFLIILPPFPLSEEEEAEFGSFEGSTDGELILVTGRSLGVPKLRDPAQAPAVWEALDEFWELTEEESMLIVDEQSGVLVLSAEERWIVDNLLHRLSRHLVDSGIQVKSVRT